jgi:hypothetical protein
MYFPLILFVLDRRHVRRRLVQERNLRGIDTSSTESTDSRSVIRHQKRIHDRRLRVQNRPISVSRKKKKRQQEQRRIQQERASGKEQNEDSEKKRQEQDDQRQSSGVEDSVDSEDQPLVIRRKKIRKKHPTGTPTKAGQRKHP